MYKEKLIALLEGLECQNIDGLIEKSSEHLKAVGIEIAKYTKIGAESDISAPTRAIHCQGDTKYKRRVHMIIHSIIHLEPKYLLDKKYVRWGKIEADLFELEDAILTRHSTGQAGSMIEQTDKI